MRVAHKWYHCRACGEEAIEADEERCPHCGILRPVILCDRCRRPIRHDSPWILRRYWADRQDEPADELTLHRRCYLHKKWLIDNCYGGTALIIKPDPRDRLTVARGVISLCLLLAVILLFAGLLKYAPKPKEEEGSFSPNIIQPYIKHPEYNQPSPMG
jgi:hypothetical protein